MPAVSLNHTATTSVHNSSTISPLVYRKRCLIISCSFDFNSLCCCVSPNSARKRGRRKSVEKIAISSDPENSEWIGSAANVSNNRLSFKSVASWRRALFESQRVRGVVLLNVSTVIYASNIPVVKEVEAVFDAGAFNVMRFALAAIPFLPIVFQARDNIHTRKAGIELGFWASMGYIMQAAGLLTSDAGRASFISMLTVIVVPLIDGMIGSVVPRHTWFGALICIMGVAMLESSGSPPCVGDLLNFFSAVFFGVHMLRTEHISRSTKKENYLPVLGYEVCIVALVSTIWYFIEGWLGGWMPELNPAAWKWESIFNWISVFPWIPALYTGSFSTSLCLWVEMVAMHDVMATEAAIIYGLEPVWGAGFAWFLLGERWGVVGWIGAALVLGGSLTVQIMGAMPLSDSSPGECENGFQDAQRDNILLSDKQK